MGDEISFEFFFFKQKTAYEIKECDWSSDVCSSDLGAERRRNRDPLGAEQPSGGDSGGRRRAEPHGRREIGRASCRERV